MNLEVFKNGITSKASRQILILQKNSPQLLFSAGVVGVVASTILACKATLRLEDEVLIPAEKKKAQSRTNAEDAVITVDIAIKVVKLYSPAVIVGVASVGALTGSHIVLSKRNVALTAAYSALEKGFSEYRDRIKEEYGEEKELEFYRNVEEVEVKGEDGKKHKVKRVGKKGLSQYARLFNRDTSNSWQMQPEYNLLFLMAQQNYANDRLKAKGHVFLNDVYDGLGLDRTQAGAVVGWIKDSEGDNFIDFGIFRGEWELHEFMTGEDGAIWLDFNVDGIIWDKI